MARLPVLVICLLLLGGQLAIAEPLRALLVSEKWPDSSTRLCSAIRSGLASAGFAVEEVDGNNLASRLDAVTGQASILVLPNARWFPCSAKQNLLSFLKHGNHLIAISGPAFEKMVVQFNGKWLEKQQAKFEIANLQGVTIYDFAVEDLSRWERHSLSKDKNETVWSAVDSGNSNVPKAMVVSISRLDDWDVLASRPLDRPFPAGYTATVFWAKGGTDTRQIEVEWIEKDGSRWQKVLDITTEWKQYVLLPDEFKYWSDKPIPNRGGLGDRFNPQNASQMIIGLSSGVTSQKMGIAHKFWVADVRVAQNPFENVDFTQPLLESISPTYKTFATRASKLRVEATGKIIDCDSDVVISIPRFPGYGCNELRSARWIPTVTALDKNHEHRGAVAHLYVNSKADYAGSVWAFIGLSQQFGQQSPDRVASVAVAMAKRIARGQFLANGGTDKFGYFFNERVSVGAYLWPQMVCFENTSLELDVIADGKSIKSRTIPLHPGVKPEQTKLQFASGELKPGRYTAQVRLMKGGKLLDEINHQFSVVKYPAITDANTVRVVNGEFHLNGNIWHPIGANYWPLWSGGQENSDLFGLWLSPEQYNPEVVERDLALCRRLGFSVLSIQYKEPGHAPALLDFASRAAALGMKLHVYIPGLDPLDSNWKKADELILAARLHECPWLFSYDLGWEVHVGDYGKRARFDMQWQRWVIDQYGSLENAFADWGYIPEIKDGVLTGPTNEQLRNDGEWRVFVAAYRRFWDDEISKRYRQVREHIRLLDSYHLMAARSGLGGTGTMALVHMFPYDLASGAKHLDYISPEAYAAGNEKDPYLMGGFVTAYARHVSGGKPVYWAEYGRSIAPDFDDASLEKQRQNYESALRMFRVSGSDGCAAWWWPGGLRLDEHSDYGIVNPDGSLRPAAVELKNAAMAWALSPTSSSDAFITVDRDEHVTGFAGVFQKHGPEYAELLMAGKNPRVRTRGAGTTSLDVPDVAVGNTVYNGNNPHKYLNAEFNYVKANGVVVRSGEEIQVPVGSSVELEVSVGNTGETRWIAGGTSKGVVFLRVSQPAGFHLQPLPADVPPLSDAIIERFIVSSNVSAKTTYTLRMTALDKAVFGEVFRINIIPVAEPPAR